MNNGAKLLFTATQLAAVLRVHRARAHQYMAGIRPGVGKVRGVKAFCWPVSAIPAPLYRELDGIAHRHGYCNVADLLDAPPAAWEPAHPLDALADDAVQKAEERRNILCDLLAADGALLLHTSELVRRAMPRFQTSAIELAASERTVRYIIDNAIERDRMMLRWDRVEIYLDEHPPLKSVPEAKAEIMRGIGGERLAQVLSQSATSATEGLPDEHAVLDAVFHEFEAHAAAGVSESAAKRELQRILDARRPGLLPATGSARSMAWRRYYQRWRDHGRTPGALADGRRGVAGAKSCVGRKQCGYVTEEEKADIQGFTRKVPGFHCVTALLLYARSLKCRRPELREAILRPRKSRHSMPEWLMKAATLPANARLKETGERRYRAEAFSVKRGGFEVMDDGIQREIEAGDWWLFDDMSQNNPFWFENVLADEDDELARKQQVSICRQSLMAMDLRSGRWLGCELVGRSRDSYRAEDILRFFFRLFVLYGLPRRGIILENGIWRCKVIAGNYDKTIEISKEDQERVIGGLRSLGIEVRHAIDAKGKALIESGFRHYQTLAAATIDGLYIGRGIGDHERGMKLFVRARAGVVHPTGANMLHIDQANVEASRVMGLCNEMQKEGDIQNGVPDEVWDKSLAANPLRPMPMEKLYVLMPTQREVKIRGGHVRPKVNGRELCFINAERFALLGNDYRLRVHFDASEPMLGAWVFNLETSTQNTDGYKVGQFICKADFAEEAPQVAYSGYVDDNIRRRKAFNGAVRIAFSTPARNGHKVTTAHEVRDGRGRVVRVEHGASAGLHDAAQLLPGGGRRAGNPRSDELAAQAKALKESRRPKTPEIDVDDLERKELELIKAGSLEPYYLTPPQEDRLAALRAARASRRVQKA